VLIGAPDRPVDKHHSTATLAEIVPNLGIHFHAILDYPEENPLEREVEQTH
jgi:hypothetical protein